MAWLCPPGRTFSAVLDDRWFYVQTSENAANALTKPLDRSKFIKHRMYLMGLAEENNYEKYQSNGV